MILISTARCLYLLGTFCIERVPVLSIRGLVHCQGWCIVWHRMVMNAFPHRWMLCLQMGVLPASGPKQPRGTAGGRMPEPTYMGLDAAWMLCMAVWAVGHVCARPAAQ